MRFPKLLRFATIAPVKAGWLLKQAGTWTLTDDGRAALDQFPDPEAFQREAIRLYGRWKADQPDEAASEEENEESESKLLAATTLEEAEESARSDILAYVAQINPYRFQDLVGKLLEAMGYHLVWSIRCG